MPLGRGIALLRITHQPTSVRLLANKRADEAEMLTQ